MKILTEACAPYGARQGLGPEPVSIWGMIDRLTEEELKTLVMGYSVHSPAYFEQQLLELHARRGPA